MLIPTHTDTNTMNQVSQTFPSPCILTTTPWSQRHQWNIPSSSAGKHWTCMWSRVGVYLMIVTIGHWEREREWEWVCVPLKGMSLWLDTFLLMLHHFDRSHCGERTLLHPPARSSHLMSFSSSTSNLEILKQTSTDFTDFQHTHNRRRWHTVTSVRGWGRPLSSTLCLRSVSSSDNSATSTDTVSQNECERDRRPTPRRRHQWRLSLGSRLPSHTQPQWGVAPPPHSIYLF